jgi:hypothetical protein
MRDISDAADLMATAREALLSELLPALPKERRYVGLMIANALAIAAREHRLGADAARSEAGRLRNLLVSIGLPAERASGAGVANDVSALRKSICAAIRAGCFDDPALERTLAAELMHTVQDWVAISNPKALRT